MTIFKFLLTLIFGLAVGGAGVLFSQKIAPGGPSETADEAEVTPADSEGVVETFEDPGTMIRGEIGGAAMGIGGGGGFAPGMAANIDFAFDGALPELPDAQAVLRRDVSGGKVAGDILQALEIPFVSPDAFENLTVENLSLVEDRDFGMSVNFAAREGTVNIYKNWQKWPNPYEKCQYSQTPDCGRLTEKDLPSDEKMLSFAANFLKKLGVDPADYGAPEIDNSWRENQRGSAELWIPDEVSVVYPLRAEGREVWQQWGGKTGLRVGIDIRQKRVASAGPFRPEVFAEVKYAGISESELRDLVRAGGGQPRPLPIGAESDRPTATLGEPTAVWVEAYFWDERANENQQLLVPALRFPVESAPPGYEIGPDAAVTIPLVRGFQAQGPVPIYLKSDAPKG